MEKFFLARKQRLKRDDKLLENGILDSLGILDVVAFIEGEFSITLSDEDLIPENFQSLEALTSFVESRHNSVSQTPLG